MRKDSVYKNFYKNILANDLGIGFSIQNLYKVSKLQRITMHNTSHAPLSKRGEILSPWAASLLLSGRRGKLLVSKRSVAGFKLKEKSLLGCSLSLRGDPLYQFLDKFLLETLPRELSNRPENWTPALEWEFVDSVGEFLLPSPGVKTGFPAVSAVASQPAFTPGKSVHSSDPPLLGGVTSKMKLGPKMRLKQPLHLQCNGYQPGAASQGGDFNSGKVTGIHPGKRGKFSGCEVGNSKDVTHTISAWRSCNIEDVTAELEKKHSKSGEEKTLSKEYNLGVSFIFSFRDLEPCFHLFQYLRGFDITFLFSTSFTISSPKFPVTEYKVNQ